MSLSVSADQELLAAAFFDNAIVIYDTNTWDVLRRLCVHNDGIVFVCFFSDYSLLIGCANGAVQQITI